MLGLIFSAIAILSDSAWELAADRVRSWFTSSPRRLELVGGAGLAICAVGPAGLVTGRRD